MTEEEKAMMALLQEPVANGRPTRHTLARMEAGEIPEEIDTAAAEGLVRELRADREAFLATRPTATFLAGIEARRRRKRPLRWLVPTSAFAAAAAAALLTWVPAEQVAESVAPPVTRLKAAPGLSFHVQRDGAVADGTPGGVYHPGDRIQLRYSTGAHRHLVVVSLDSSGAVTPFYDAGGRSLGIEPGVAQLLDGSVELDGALGPERIVGCFSEEPLSTARIVKSGEAALAAAGGDPARVDRLDAACAQATFLIDKRRRGP